jgi:metal-sulfur cluster biosynthetic enzyme
MAIKTVKVRLPQLDESVFELCLIYEVDSNQG